MKHRGAVFFPFFLLGIGFLGAQAFGCTGGLLVGSADAGLDGGDAAPVVGDEANALSAARSPRPDAAGQLHRKREDVRGLHRLLLPEEDPRLRAQSLQSDARDAVFLEREYRKAEHRRRSDSPRRKRRHRVRPPRSGHACDQRAGVRRRGPRSKTGSWRPISGRTRPSWRPSSRRSPRHTTERSTCASVASPLDCASRALRSSPATRPPAGARSTPSRKRMGGPFTRPTSTRSRGPRDPRTPALRAERAMRETTPRSSTQAAMLRMGEDAGDGNDDAGERVRRLTRTSLSSASPDGISGSPPEMAESSTTWIKPPRARSHFWTSRAVTWPTIPPTRTPGRAPPPRWLALSHLRARAPNTRRGSTITRTSFTSCRPAGHDALPASPVITPRTTRSSAETQASVAAPGS